MKNYRFYLTPAAGKELIARAIPEHPAVRAALNGGRILILSGTTNFHVANELLRLIGSDQRTDCPSFHKGVTVPRGAHIQVLPFPGHVLIENGTAGYVQDLAAACDRMTRGDVILKGANALSLATKTAAILIGNDENGGTIMEACRPVLARRTKLILPVGVEKRVDLPMHELTARCNDPEMTGLRFFEAPGEAFTEIDAIRLLTDSDAVIIGAGGVNGAEGGTYFDAQGGDLEKLKELISSLDRTPADFC